MGDRLEDRIRDHLATHLDLLESGLTLVDIEYPLPSTAGAGARIDIVARDQFGQVVVIEIKRSDQAARQAINEICKYVALFRICKGLDECRLRVIVVSTDWHELLLPLSEFANTSEYAVEGFQIAVQSDGSVISCLRRPLVPTGGAVQISREQMIYFFTDAFQRDSFIPELASAAEQSGVQDYVVFRCDYRGGRNRVIFPHAAYFCFSSPLHGLSSADAANCKAGIPWDEELDDPDTNFLTAINENPHTVCDSCEIGYPEKLTNMATGWSISAAKQAGRLKAAAALLGEPELIGLATFTEGGSDYYLNKVTSPRFGAAWRKLLVGAESVLRGNAHWEELVPHILAEIERRCPRATVAAQFYVPGNLPLSLYHIARRQDFSYCPGFQLVVDDHESNSVQVINGILVWSGAPVTRPLIQVILEAFGGIDEWTMALHFGATFEHENELMEACHLLPVVVEWHLSAESEVGPTEVTLDQGAIARRPFDEAQLRPLLEFAREQEPFLNSLKHDVEQLVTEPPGPAE